MRTLRVAATAVPVILAGCASQNGFTGQSAAAESETDCMFTRSIDDWEALDDHNLIVYAMGNQPYHVELLGSCFNLEFANVIAFYDRRADDRICGFGMDRIIVDRTLPESCGIVAVDELTEPQAQELLIRFGKAEPGEIDVEPASVE